MRMKQQHHHLTFIFTYICTYFTIIPVQVHVLHILLSIERVCSANSNTHTTIYNAYNYDMTTPMFTPDGRLLQVEYASIAAKDRSSPILALTLRQDQEDVIVLGCNRSRMGGRVSGQQRRLIPMIANGCDRPNVCVCMSGVLSDAVALLQEVRKHFDSWGRTYGYGSSSSVFMLARLATVIGDACQSHAFGGGLRPYGASFLICGLELDNSNSLRAKMYTTFPSGSVIDVDIESSLRSNGNTFVCTVTGESTISDRLRLAVLHKLSNDDNNCNSSTTLAGSENNRNLRKGVDAIISVMYEEHQKNNKIIMNNQENDNDAGMRNKFQPEVVLITSQGVQVIGNDDLEYLVRPIISHCENEA